MTTFEAEAVLEALVAGYPRAAPISVYSRGRWHDACSSLSLPTPECMAESRLSIRVGYDSSRQRTTTRGLHVTSAVLRDTPRVKARSLQR